MVYLHEFEFYTAESTNQAMVEPLGFEQDALPIDGLSEAVEAAHEWLTSRIDDVLVQQRVPRKEELGGAAKHNGYVFSVGVTRSLGSIPAVTASDAATMLGISRSRVAQLCAAGALESWKEGAHRMVSMRSLESRMSSMVDEAAANPEPAAPPRW